MRGMELAKRYFGTFGPVLVSGLPYSVESRLAFGLVGPGSECLGFDDDISRDHDFGPGFCVWIPADLWDTYGSELARRYATLPGEFLGEKRKESELAGQRVGVFCTESFYRTYTGLGRVPQGVAEWLRIPEQLLAIVCGGEVFRDPSGQFTRVREAYQGFYPELVVRKKLAADMAVMAQSGQYNLGRCLVRRDLVAADVARGEFLCATMAALHLLSRTYMPFYKWSFRSLRESAHVPAPVCDVVRRIAAAPVAKVSCEDVELLCSVVLRAALALGWAASESDFLLDAATSMWRGIPNEYLRSRPLNEGAFSHGM
ncbi:DUF4037 domain-containing protein [Parafannyhessea umbonata]|uniref:DUF4037 domain-containing protein n=1 Tax=Parafannyhessea umbonata TaxID=604330 RepID=UPI002EC817BE|nr:DUF4037 domain-containing protein [Parafannyhessea umbonata]